MAVDWMRGYGVDYEYWEVDPATYRNVRRLDQVESCEITRDAADETLGSASMGLSDEIEPETWVRAYLLATQGGSTERVCLGTFLALSADEEMDGKSSVLTAELHTPLKELKDDGPPAGYPVRKGSDAVAAASALLGRFHARIAGGSESRALLRQVAASDSDSWLSLASKVLAEAGMELTLDPMGVIGFAPVRDAAALAPAWAFADDGSSILCAKARLGRGWGDVPNVVRVTVSETGASARGEAVNASESSPVSTVSRGRVVSMTEANPDGVSTPEQAAARAARRLREESAAERRLSFSHGYCPVRLGDCVRVSYSAHGLDCKAKVVRQTIRCVTDLEVECEAVYSEEAWNGEG